MNFPSQATVNCSSEYLRANHRSSRPKNTFLYWFLAHSSEPLAMVLGRESSRFNMRLRPIAMSDRREIGSFCGVVVVRNQICRLRNFFRECRSVGLEWSFFHPERDLHFLFIISIYAKEEVSAKNETIRGRKSWLRAKRCASRCRCAHCTEEKWFQANWHFVSTSVATPS